LSEGRVPARGKRLLLTVSFVPFPNAWARIFPATKYAGKRTEAYGPMFFARYFHEGTANPTPRRTLSDMVMYS
jgi:hypothetical protein